MTMHSSNKDIGVEIDKHIAVVEMRRPPHNFFGLAFLADLASTLESLEKDDAVRSILLCAEGSSFSAGADFADRDSVPKPKSARSVNPIYAEAVRLFAIGKPIVAAVQGAAVGGGLGLALVADFRVTCADARFSANFARLGITPGFGLTATLPRLIGTQKAAEMFYTGKRIGGEEAVAIGLADVLVERADVRQRAVEMCTEIAISSPLVVRAVRATLRAGLVDTVRVAVARESAEQHRQFETKDFQEGVAAMAARRLPEFRGASM
jgi:enoyl-CoA hydratase/carnithine racemase